VDLAFRSGLVGAMKTKAFSERHGLRCGRLNGAAQEAASGGGLFASATTCNWAATTISLHMHCIVRTEKEKSRGGTVAHASDK